MSILVYLRFVLGPEADGEVFERDLGAMQEPAGDRPGFRWSEVAGDPWGDRTYVVVSEWDEVDQVRACEHHTEHVAITERWEPQYAEPFVHRRFVPWIRPEEART